MSTEMQGWHPVSSNNSSSLLSSLEGTNYADLIRANPYRNIEYKKSPWQNFLTSLGIRTQADAWQENMQVQANEYDAAIAQKAYNEQYESPIAEAGRMREAGMNPDLQGIGDVAGAADMPEDPSTPMQTTADDQGMIVQAANFIMSAVSQGFALAQNLGALRNMRITNEAGELENSEKVSKFAEWLVGQAPFDESGMDIEQLSEYRSNLSTDLFKNHHSAVPRKYRKQFRKDLDSFVASLKTHAASSALAKQNASDRLDLARMTSSKWYSKDMTAMKEVNKTLVSLSDALAEYTLQNKFDYERQYNGEAKALSENAENSFKTEYYGTLNGKTMAGSENAQNSYNEQLKTVDKIINNSIASLVHRLARYANNGDPVSQGLLFSFAMARMTSVNLGPKGLSLGFNPQ